MICLSANLKEIRKYSFEKLEVWQLSKELTKDIYTIKLTIWNSKK